MRRLQLFQSTRADIRPRGRRVSRPALSWAQTNSSIVADVALTVAIARRGYTRHFIETTMRAVTRACPPGARLRALARGGRSACRDGRLERLHGAGGRRASARSSSAPSTTRASRSRASGPTDFVVREDGRRREVLRVSRATRADRHRAARGQQRGRRRSHPVDSRGLKALRRADGGRQPDRDRRPGRSADDPRRLHDRAGAAGTRRRPPVRDAEQRHDAARRDRRDVAAACGGAKRRAR